MTRPLHRHEAIAVLDVGKTNVKLLAIAADGRISSSRVAPNAVKRGKPYPHCDSDHIWRWLLAALSDIADNFALQAIVPTSYGSTVALVDDDELVLPILDYEAEPPDDIAAAYAEVAPWFDECCCPINPACLTLGRQLFWQSRQFADSFARTRWILPFPQYWAWRLCGVPASEVTSLGAQTQLWDPRARNFSSLAQSEGWADKFPPMRNAWDVLGTLQYQVAEKCGLPSDLPVLCGIHDSNANYVRYLAAGLERFTLLSTGTWLITFNPGQPLDRLEPLRDTVSNTDLLGRPVASARFMGGREYAEIAGEDGVDIAPGPSDVQALIDRETMALPSFTDSGGPFPDSGGLGRIVGPEPASARERAALASLYVALMANVGMDLLGARDPLIIDGSFAENPLFAGSLAALRPDQPVAVSREREGTALGAALLWSWSSRSTPAPLEQTAIEPVSLAGLHDYAARWRAAIESSGRI